MERGLWQNFTQAQIDGGLPVIQLKCAECKKSGAQQDARARAAEMMKNAEAGGYFIPEQPEMNESTSLTRSTTTCCWSKILASQSDFKGERPLLQTIIEDAGHICIFLPKFHCELNPIELLWAYIQQGKILIVKPGIILSTLTDILDVL